MIRLTLKQSELAKAEAAGDTEALKHYQGHTSDENDNLAVIVAAIVGGLIMLTLVTFMLCKALKRQKTYQMCRVKPKGEASDKIMVNMSSVRSDD